MKKLVYLISPNKINKKFYRNLDNVLSYGNVKFFQLRLKKVKEIIIKYCVKLEKLHLKHKVKFIINDNYILASKLKLMDVIWVSLMVLVKIAKKKLKNKILGVTCHNSKILAKNAIKDKANYLAFGSFLNLNLNQMQ